MDFYIPQAPGQAVRQSTCEKGLGTACVVVLWFCVLVLINVASIIDQLCLN